LNDSPGDACAHVAVICSGAAVLLQSLWMSIVPHLTPQTTNHTKNSLPRLDMLFKQNQENVFSSRINPGVIQAGLECSASANVRSSGFNEGIPKNLRIFG